MFALLRKWTKAKQSPPHNINVTNRRAILGVEVMEDRLVPAVAPAPVPVVVYSNTFDWNAVALVNVTVTNNAPGHVGQYLWDYHVTNESFGSGIATFAVPAEDSSLVSGLGSSVGWSGSIGTLLSDPDMVSWQAGGTQPVLGIGDSADFWFTTTPTGLALTNGIISNPGLTGLPGGLLVVPTAAPAPLGPAVAPLPTIIVTTELDETDANNGLTSLREAIEWVNAQNTPTQQLQVRFASNLTGDTITLGELGQLPLITKNIFINGADRGITVERDATQGDFRLISGFDTSKITIAGLTLQNGGGPNFEGTGGAISTAGDLSIQGCIIRDNNASKGGGIYCAGDLSIQGCTIRDNNAPGGDGGGVYAAGKLALQGGGVFKNKASDGGGIYAGAGEVDIQNTVLYANEADNGGGIYVGNHVTKAEIADTQIYSNTAEIRGGGAYVVGGTNGGVTTVTLRQCAIYWNRAQRGGGVAAMKDVLNVISTTVTNNEALGERGLGGGVYLGFQIAAANFNNSTLAGNSATKSGGGIWVDTLEDFSPAITLDNTWVVGNEATDRGGGIGVQSSAGTPQLTLKGNSLIGFNTLTASISFGGGLFLGCGTVTCDGVTFGTNTAAFATGFYAASGTQVIEGPGGVTFHNDTWFIE